MLQTMLNQRIVTVKITWHDLNRLIKLCSMVDDSKDYERLHDILTEQRNAFDAKYKIT